MMLHVPGLYIQDTVKKGRGVFCAHDLQEGDTIELCPLIVIPPSEVAAIHETHLHDYYFLWPAVNGAACIALGYGSLYNHHSDPNAQVIMDLDNEMIEIRGIKAIPAGTEILIDYTDGGASEEPLWFQEE